jgi:FkbM family methyltransferase
MFPIPRLFPISSFFERLVEKNVHALSWYLLSQIGFSGSTFLRRDDIGNGVLCLNRDSPLGNKGDEISLPIDNVIFQWVLRRGRWEEQESNFLANYVNEFDSENIVFIDIGGQAGLVTRQFLCRLERPISKAWIVEPYSAHISAIQNNCYKWITNGVLEIFPYALDDIESQRQLHIQNTNSGNASLIELFQNSDSSSSYLVEVKSVIEFEKLSSKANSRIVLKCDIQGMDAKVLSLFSKEFWSQVTCCVIEIWAIPAIEVSEVETLLKCWEHFVTLSWDSTREKKCNLDEVRNFWLSKSGSTRNLYISA